MKKPYCIQDDGDCANCCYVNYGKDCYNQPIDKKASPEIIKFAKLHHEAVKELYKLAGKKREVGM